MAGDANRISQTVTGAYFIYGGEKIYNYFMLERIGSHTLIPCSTVRDYHRKHLPLPVCNRTSFLRTGDKTGLYATVY